MSISSKPTAAVPVHPLVKFVTCVGGIYVSFMIWALVSVLCSRFDRMNKRA